jgi:hypothetical protein
LNSYSLAIFLPQPLGSWNYTYVPECLTHTFKVQGDGGDECDQSTLHMYENSTMKPT